MCVIFYAPKVHPTEDMVKRAWDFNKDGGGLAYRKDGYVYFEKGIMKLEDFMPKVLSAPLPFIAHFRVASVGGVKPELTHPFPIANHAPLMLKGRTRGGVLFHNGHWQPWQDKVYEAAVHSNTKIPTGDIWSDTRAMAYLTSLYGPGTLNVLQGQKGIIMTPDNYHFYTGNGWELINDVWCSNDYFWTGRRPHRAGANGGNSSTYQQNYGSRICSRGKCMNSVSGGKDVCDSCQKEREKEAVNSIPQKETKQGSAMALLTGGTQRPLALVLTLKELETYRSQKWVSKNKYKRFRKFYDELGNGSNSKKLRVKAELEKLSEEIAETVLEIMSRHAGGSES